MTGELDDAGLLRAASTGDPSAFEVLYDRLAPMVLLRLRRRCSEQEVVADVLQETFMAVWRSAGTWDGRGDVGVGLDDCRSSFDRRLSPACCGRPGTAVGGGRRQDGRAGGGVC